MNTVNVGTLFPKTGQDSFLSLANEHANIRSGSYRNVVKKYYKNYSADGTAKNMPIPNSIGETTYVSKKNEKMANLSELSDKATTLKTAASKLSSIKSSPSSLFTEEETAKEDTTTVGESEKYADLVNAAKTLISAYNDTLDASAKIDASNVTKKAKWLLEVSEQHKFDLKSIGIEKEGDRLKLDEDKFKNSTIKEVRDTLGGANSVSTSLMKKTESLADAAMKEATKTATAYNKNAQRYQTTQLYNQWEAWM